MHTYYRRCTIIIVSDSREYELNTIIHLIICNMSMKFYVYAHNSQIVVQVSPLEIPIRN